MANVQASFQVTTPVIQAGAAFRCVLTLTNSASTAIQVVAVRQVYLTSSGAIMSAGGAAPRSGVTFPLGPGPDNLLAAGPVQGTPGIGGAGNTIPANGSASWTFSANMFASMQDAISMLFWTSVVVTFNDGTMLGSPLAQVTILRPTFLRSLVIPIANLNPTSGVTFPTSVPSPGQLGYDFTTPGSSFFTV